MSSTKNITTGNISFQKKTRDKLFPTQIEQEPEKDSIIQTWEEIEQIRRENKELRDEIETEARMNSLSGPVLEAKMEKVQKISSLIAQKIEMESQKKRDLETLINVTSEGINNTMKKLNQSNGVALPQLQAKIKQLEYKLEKTRGRHNESLAQINMLKEEVNMVRRERVIFSNVFKKLESDIKLKDEEFKKYMLEKMQVDIKKKNLEEELQKIKAQAKREVLNFKTEYQAIFNSTRQFNNSEMANQESSQKRIFDTEILLNDHNTNNTHIQNNNSILSHSPPANSTNPAIAQILQNQSTLTSRSPANKHNSAINLQATQEELQKYQFMFQKVQKEVGIDDLDSLIDLFQNIEKQNDELYESANQKSDEIDDLEKKIKEAEKEIGKYTKNKDQKQTGNVQQDKNQQEAQKLSKKIENVDAMTKSVNSDIQSVTAKLAKIASQYGVKIPEGVIFCSPPREIIHILFSQELDDTSFIAFLKDVESRIYDIINIYMYSKGEVVNIDRQRETHGTLSSQNRKGEAGPGIAQVLDGVKKKSDSEAERILTKGDFNSESTKEIKQFKDVKTKTQVVQKGKKQKP